MCGSELRRKGDQTRGTIGQANELPADELRGARNHRLLPNNLPGSPVDGIGRTQTSGSPAGELAAAVRATAAQDTVLEKIYATPEPTHRHNSAVATPGVRYRPRHVLSRVPPSLSG